MEFTFTEGEVHVIRVWADSSIHGGHWGDGDVIVPEEEIILKKLDNMKDNVLTLNEKEAQIIMTWSDSTYGIHTLEEESVIKKISSIINV